MGSLQVHFHTPHSTQYISTTHTTHYMHTSTPHTPLTTCTHPHHTHHSLHAHIHTTHTTHYMHTSTPHTPLTTCTHPHHTHHSLHAHIHTTHTTHYMHTSTPHTPLTTCTHPHHTCSCMHKATHTFMYATHTHTCTHTHTHTHTLWFMYAVFAHISTSRICYRSYECVGHTHTCGVTLLIYPHHTCTTHVSTHITHTTHMCSSSCNVCFGIGVLQRCVGLWLCRVCGSCANCGSKSPGSEVGSKWKHEVGTFNLLYCHVVSYYYYLLPVPWE